MIHVDTKLYLIIFVLQTLAYGNSVLLETPLWCTFPQINQKYEETEDQVNF